MKLAWDSKYRVEKHDGSYQREESDPRYHTTRWAKLSRRWRLMHPLCAECARKGLIREAQCVDHIIPAPICEDFFDEGNLQSLCNECNMLKGIQDRKTIAKHRQQAKAQQVNDSNLK